MFGIPRKLLAEIVTALKKLIWFWTVFCIHYKCLAHPCFRKFFIGNHSSQKRMARTARTGLSGQDSWELTARNGYPGQDRQDRTARTGMPGKDSQKRRQIARTEEPRLDCKERIASKDSQNLTTRTGRPWLTEKLGQYLEMTYGYRDFFASRQFVKKSTF